MSVVALDVATRRPSSARLHAVSSKSLTDEAPTVAWRTDATVVSVALAVLAVLGMFTVFAAIADSKPVVVACAVVSVVVSVATAFWQLRRAGL
mgnify:FL=1